MGLLPRRRPKSPIREARILHQPPARTHHHHHHHPISRFFGLAHLRPGIIIKKKKRPGPAGGSLERVVYVGGVWGWSLALVWGELAVWRSRRVAGFPKSGREMGWERTPRGEGKCTRVWAWMLWLGFG
ncbi:hypothetical protein K505DRAFT_152093 [Melanomma pulvis-pyrius CBS 109.77]|uniref:Uncharacterized protein n=1 Tax=Melanomma pulvis-pyrius CBS 109.77 TaxID=1314802 RepID=A0A6A6XVK5_9PLEO|nr:hypothetical protein K505DRAFT_152093 [Melanomma pulvis-pyrius CBS 109.77]